MGSSSFPIMDCILETVRLSKEYRVGFIGKRVKALNSVSIQINRGEIYGYLGHNGAGKTTTIKILTGLIYPTSGMATIFGQSCCNSGIRQSIGFLPEHPYFYDYLTVYEILKFYAALFGIRKSVSTKRIHELVSRLGLERVVNSKIRTLSKGLVQRVGIAQSMINNPGLLIWDEPMSGLDPIGRKEIKDLILDLKNEGRTVFLSSHVLSDMEMVCDRVAILIRGRIAYEGYVRDIIEEKASTRYIELTVMCNNVSGFEKIEHLEYEKFRRENTVYIKVPSYKHLDLLIPEIVADKSLKILAIIPHRETLEDIFAKEMSSYNKNGNT